MLAIRWVMSSNRLENVSRDCVGDERQIYCDGIASTKKFTQMYNCIWTLWTYIRVVSPYNIPEEYIKQVDIKIQSMIKWGSNVDWWLDNLRRTLSLTVKRKHAPIQNITCDKFLSTTSTTVYCRSIINICFLTWYRSSMFSCYGRCAMRRSTWKTWSYKRLRLN